MAVGEVISGATGTGTASDPYKPTTFLAWKTAVGTTSAYVCMEQDIDVSKDSVYKTGLTENIAINCTSLYGTAETYDNTRTYNRYDKCTFNDGEHGLCTYTCQSDGVTGVDVSDTTYWTRGGDPTKKLTGLIITYGYFFGMNSNSQLISNLFFESCVFDRNTSFSYQGLIYKSGSTCTFNDCKFSFFYNQHTGGWNWLTGYGNTYLNRCSVYIRYAHGTLSSISANKFISGNASQLNNCTVSLIGFGASGDNCSNSCLGYVTNCSFYIELDMNINTYGNYTFTLGYTTNCFYAIKINEVVGQYANNVSIQSIPSAMYGTNIIDKDIAGSIPIGTNANLIKGTTAQCKDKDWLISQGFFAS